MKLNQATREHLDSFIERDGYIEGTEIPPKSVPVLLEYANEINADVHYVATGDTYKVTIIPNDEDIID